jgi:hypothetical protein
MAQTVRRRVAAGLCAVVLGGLPAVAHAQVFLASKPHPGFAIGPLFILARVNPDLSAVSVRVSWSLVLGPDTRAADVPQDLYLLWPAEIAPAGGTPVPGDGALRRYVEERGFAVVNDGRLSLAVRDRTKLGTGVEGDPIAEFVSYVTLYKRGTNPAQSGVGTFIRIPWTPRLLDAGSLMTFTMPLKDLIAPSPATWLEELFWGRRNVLSLGVGGAGSVALYSMYFDQRDRVLPLAPDFSLLVTEFADAEHLRIDAINPPGAIRRPSRVRAGAETVVLALGSTEGVPQLLTVRFSYFSGGVSWRPIVVSLVALALGNLMGAFMFTRAVAGFVGRTVKLSRGDQGRAAGDTLPAPTALARIVPGETTHAEVLTLCGLPSEERARLGADRPRTLVYRGTRQAPRRRPLGWLSAVSGGDEEHHEVEIDFEDGRVSDVATRVRRSRPR